MLAEVVLTGWILIWGPQESDRKYYDGPYPSQLACFEAAMTVPKHYRVYRCRYVKISKQPSKG